LSLIPLTFPPEADLPRAEILSPKGRGKKSPPPEEKKRNKMPSPHWGEGKGEGVSSY